MRLTAKASRYLKSGIIVGFIVAGGALWADSTTSTTTTTVKTSKKSPKVTDARGDEGPPRGDNTAKNADATPTADTQNNDKNDVELTAKIRRAVVADKKLSVAAQNVKIITQSGVVTLKGPVRSTDERFLVAKKAGEIAGPSNVRNEMDVAP